MAHTVSKAIPRAFVWRRLHSLAGLWFLLFLIEHLFTNSQAVLFFSSGNMAFVRSVNFLHNIPYLKIIEVALLGVPILLHAGLGVRYLFTAKFNSLPSDGAKPAIRKSRNYAYSWQRIASWILLVGIILHVFYMRFYIYPSSIEIGQKHYYFATYELDPGLYPAANRLGVKLYDENAVASEKNALKREASKAHRVEQRLTDLEKDERSSGSTTYNLELDSAYQAQDRFTFNRLFVEALESRPIKQNEVIAATDDFGKLILLNVRSSFQSLIKCLLYTIFVAAAVFHGFQGLWTFLITWGLVLMPRSQSQMVSVCVALMVILGFLGMMGVWGPYIF